VLVGVSVGVVVDSFLGSVGALVGMATVARGVGVGVSVGTATTTWDVVTGRGLGGRVEMGVGSGAQATSALNMQARMRNRK